MDQKEEKDVGTEERSKKPLFRSLNPEDDELETSEIESLCMNCEETVSS